jgi:pimeloyl-ACP methyl ester carboxylesterase
MKLFSHKSGQSLEIDSASIYYEIAGTADKPVLLVLHGGFGTLEDIDQLLPELSLNFTLIGIDSRGHGKSSIGSENLTYARLQKDVEQILQHLNIEKLSIIGFSDGGIIGYRLAAFSDLKIEKLVTIGSRWHYNNVNDTRDILQSVTGEGWKNKFPATFENYQKLNPEPDFEKLAVSLVRMWLDPEPSGYPNEHIQKFTGQLLIIRGDNDPLLPLQAVIELKESVKNSSLLNVPFASHAAFATQAGIMKISLGHFLNITDKL